jgi:hypothetical protein
VCLFRLGLSFAFDWLMNSEQGPRLAAAFAGRSAGSGTTSLCGVCVDVLAVTGVGITLMGGYAAGPICVSSERVRSLEDLQFVLGEGPCQDSYHLRAPVLAPRMDQHAYARWPAFVSEARSSGIGAVFAFPMVTGRSRLGVLTVYQDGAGDLSSAQAEDSIALAEVLTLTVLGMQARATPGMVPVELDDAVEHRAEVHQATGMVAVQLTVPLTDALAAIRAHAFVNEMPIAEVAAGVVARRLRFSNDADGTHA